MKRIIHKIRHSIKKISNSRNIINELLVYRDSISKLDDLSRNMAKSKLAVVIHLYYVESWKYFAKKLNNLNRITFDLVITIPKHNLYFVNEIKETYPNACILIVPNHGRDVLPFIMVARKLYGLGYEYVLKFHSKKSTHRDDGQEWLEDMLDKMLPGNQKLLNNIYNKLNDKTTGIIGPEGVYYPLTVNFPANGEHMTNIANKLYGKKETRRYLQTERSEYGFFGGTMFWARLDAIKMLLSVPIFMFEIEAGQIDGTFAHALERLLTVVPEVEGKLNYEISKDSVNIRPYASDNIPEWSKDHLK